MSWGVISCFHLASFTFFWSRKYNNSNIIAHLFYDRIIECSVAELWGWRRSSLSQVNWTTALQNTGAMMLLLNYILLRQSSQPFLGSILRHRAKCDLVIHRLRAPSTPVMHFQLSELCIAFKKHSLSIANNSHLFSLFYCWEHIRKCCMLPKLLFNRRKVKAEMGLNNPLALKIQKHLRL